jgi:hypothetical protein
MPDVPALPALESGVVGDSCRGGRGGGSPSPPQLRNPEGLSFEAVVGGLGGTGRVPPPWGSKGATAPLIFLTCVHSL